MQTGDRSEASEGSAKSLPAWPELEQTSSPAPRPGARPNGGVPCPGIPVGLRILEIADGDRPPGAVLRASQPCCLRVADVTPFRARQPTPTPCRRCLSKPCTEWYLLFR